MASTVARRFAQGLLNILDSDEAVERVEKDLDAVQQILASLPGLGRILTNPAVDPARRKQLLGELMGRIEAHPASAGAIALLAEQRELRALPDLIATYRRLKDARLGVTSVGVISAKEIPEVDRPGWERALSKLVGTPVRIDYETDPALIGGAVAKVGSVLYDGSVRGSLHKIRQSLLGE